MKKLLTLLLALLLALTMSACYTVMPEDEESPPGPEPTAEPEESPPEPEPTAEPTAEPTPEATAPPTASPEPAAAPESPVGQTLEELEESVEISLADGIKDRPEVLDDGLKEVIYGSAHSWMRNTFIGQEFNGRLVQPTDFECVRLTLSDISEDGRLFLYGAAFDFLPSSDECLSYWMAGNTKPGRDGWYHFSRQIAVKRDGKSWEIMGVGTGGMSIEDLIKKAEANDL